MWGHYRSAGDKERLKPCFVPSCKPKIQHTPSGGAFAMCKEWGDAATVKTVTSSVMGMWASKRSLLFLEAKGLIWVLDKNRKDPVIQDAEHLHFGRWGCSAMLRWHYAALQDQDLEQYRHWVFEHLSLLVLCLNFYDWEWHAGSFLCRVSSGDQADLSLKQRSYSFGEQKKKLLYMEEWLILHLLENLKKSSVLGFQGFYWNCIYYTDHLYYICRLNWKNSTPGRCRVAVLEEITCWYS